MKTYNINKCLWGVCLTILAFVITGCGDDEDEFSDLNPNISWNIDNDEVLRLEDYTGNLGANTQFYGVNENLITITYDKSTNSHIVTPKNIGGNKFEVHVGKRIYNVHLKVYHYITKRAFIVKSRENEIECAPEIKENIEKELDEKNYFLDNSTGILFYYDDSSSLRYKAFLSHNDENSVVCDTDYNTETKEFTFTDNANPEYSQTVVFHLTEAPYCLISDFTDEMKQKYGNEKVTKACIYYYYE